MKTRVLLILLFVLSTVPAWTQKSDQYTELISQGDLFFQEQQYNLAIQYYRDALSLNASNVSIDYKLAESYRNIFNYPEAEAYYLKVLYTDQSQYPLSLYY